MPRRSPSAVRADFPPRAVRQGSSAAFSVIAGLTADSQREIRHWEQTHAAPGRLSQALAAWKRQAAFICSGRWRGWTANTETYYGNSGCPCCDDPDDDARATLEDAMQSLSRRARRELAAVVAPVDQRILASTYGPGPTEPGWWTRRM